MLSIDPRRPFEMATATVSPRCSGWRPDSSTRERWTKTLRPAQSLAPRASTSCSLSLGRGVAFRQRAFSSMVTLIAAGDETLEGLRIGVTASVTASGLRRA
jgi:hypothetical protein